MAERNLSTVEIRDFPGLVLRADPHEIPPGAAKIQVNVASDAQAQLRVRPGYRAVSFEATGAC